MKFTEKGPRKVYNIDIDGILTNNEPFWEQEPTPNLESIKNLHKLYGEGNVIIIHTARQWEFAPETVAWLIKHRVPFHGIYMAKGGSDCYIDDKATKEFPRGEKWGKVKGKPGLIRRI